MEELSLIMEDKEIDNIDDEFKYAEEFERLMASISTQDLDIQEIYNDMYKEEYKEETKKTKSKVININSGIEDVKNTRKQRNPVFYYILEAELISKIKEITDVNPFRDIIYSLKKEELEDYREYNLNQIKELIKKWEESKIIA